MDTPPHSAAYEMGRAFGPMIGAIIFLVAFLGYSIGLWKYSKSRHAAWLVTTIVLALPMLGLFALLMLTGIVALANGLKPAAAEKAAASREAVDLLKEKFDTLHGAKFDYTIEVPDLPEWKKDTSMGAFDQVLSYRDLYIGILSERMGMGDSDTVRQMAERNLAGSADEHNIRKAKPVTIGGLPWLTFDADAKVQKMSIKYRYFVYSDTRHTVQIIVWSSPRLIDENSFLVDQIARSFRFGKD